MRVSSGQPAALRAALADRVAALRHEDPLAPIRVLVGTSLQRPFLQRWLAARLGAHANVRVLMPGDLALLLGAPALVAAQGAGRCRRWPTGCCWPTSRASTRGTSRRSPRRRGSARRCSGWCGSCAARAMTSRTSDRCWMGRPTRRRRRARSPEILAEFEQRRVGLLRPGRRAAGRRPGSPRRARAARLGDARRAAGARAAAAQDRRADAGRRLSRRSSRGRGRAVRRAAGTADRRRSRGAPGRRVAQRQDTALARVRRSMFTAPAKPAIPADGTLRLVSAPDPSREVRAAARACLQWAREGVPFWDMAVAYRHGEAYLPLAEAVFVEAGIPVYLHEGSPLAERPIGRQTLGAAGAVRRRAVAPVGDGLPDRREVPGGAARRVRRDPGVAMGLALARRRDRQGRRAVAQRLALGAVSSDADDDALPGLGPPACRGRRPARTVHRRPGPPPAGAAGAGARWAEHLDYLQGLLARYVEGADEVIVALRGLERFTALEAEVDFDWFLDVVERAIGTLRSEDVIDSRPGAFAARGREHRRGQLAARGSSSRACGSSARPSGRSRRRCARTRSCSTTSARRSPSGRRRRSRRGRRAAARRR